MSRTARKRVAPVWERARAVSVPRPEEQPVIRIVLWEREEVRDWEVMMSRAVGDSILLPFFPFMLGWV